jgi:hypothetical protein
MVKNTDKGIGVNSPVLTLEGKSKFPIRAKELFKNHPGAKEVHFTSDGLAFFGLNDAQNHSGGLKDKEIETIKNEQ